eukprot:jgi/Chlat1/8460/Chrsp80S07868
MCQAAGDGDQPGVDTAEQTSFDANSEGPDRSNTESPEFKSTAQALLERAQRGKQSASHVLRLRQCLPALWEQAQSALRDASELLQKPLGSRIREGTRIERNEEATDTTRSVLRQTLRAEGAGATVVDNGQTTGNLRQSNGTATILPPAGTSIVDNDQFPGTRRGARNVGTTRPPTGPSAVDNDQPPASASIADNDQPTGTRRGAQNIGTMSRSTGPNVVDHDQSTDTRRQSTGRIRPPAGPLSDQDQSTSTRTQSTVIGGTSTLPGASIYDIDQFNDTMRQGARTARPPAGASADDNEPSTTASRRPSTDSGSVTPPAGSVGDKDSSTGTRRQLQSNGSTRSPPAGTEVVDNDQTFAALRQSPAGASRLVGDEQSTTSRRPVSDTGSITPAGGSVGDKDQSTGTRSQSQTKGSMRPPPAGTEVVDNNQTSAALRQSPAGASSWVDNEQSTASRTPITDIGRVTPPASGSVGDKGQSTGTRSQSKTNGSMRPPPAGTEVDNDQTIAALRQSQAGASSFVDMDQSLSAVRQSTESGASLDSGNYAAGSSTDNYDYEYEYDQSSVTTSTGGTRPPAGVSVGDNNQFTQTLRHAGTLQPPAGARAVDNEQSTVRRPSMDTGTESPPAGGSYDDKEQFTGTRGQSQTNGTMRPSPAGKEDVDSDQTIAVVRQSPVGASSFVDNERSTASRGPSTDAGRVTPPAGGSVGYINLSTTRQSQTNGSMRPPPGTEVVDNYQTTAALGDEDQPTTRQSLAGASSFADMDQFPTVRQSADSGASSSEHDSRAAGSSDDYADGYNYDDDQSSGTSRQSALTGTRRPSLTQRQGELMKANLGWGAERARFSDNVFNQDPTPWSPTPQMQRAEAKAKSSTSYVEPEQPTTLQHVLERSALPPLQSEVECMAVLGAELPPLQSVVEMTTAYRPPMQSEGSEQILEVHPAHGDHWGEDMGLGESSSIAEDGTQWWRASGEELGEKGLRVKWTLLRGVTAAGIEWEETWWEKSDWLGYRELGARKSGADENGGSWTETWTEALTQDSDNGVTGIEKSAHKWAQNGQGDEWEEKWWESYDTCGWTSKTADKWAKRPGHVHHERWGEEWDGKGAASKWTDRWAEEVDPYTGMLLLAVANLFTRAGKRREWGDKWEEKYGWGGEGHKSGQNWSKEEGSEEYLRSWGENHFGNGMVQKYGHSTTGEHWDTTEPGDTWFERRPHYGFEEAYQNSWNLRQVQPR